MRCLGWFMLGLSALLVSMPAAAQTRDEQACLHSAPDRNTMAACNRLIEEKSGEIRKVVAGERKPEKGWTKDGLLSALYNLRGGAHQKIAGRHAANEEREKAADFHLRAIKDFDAALRHDPASPHAVLNRGSSRAALVELDSAIEDFKEALRLAPKNAQEMNVKAYNNLGGAYRDNRDESAALAELERALRLDPKFALALFNRGTVHLQKGRYDLAIADYTAAMRYGPKDIDTLGARGRARRDSGDYKGAMADFEAALKLSAQDKRSKSVQDAVRGLLRVLREEVEREETKRRRVEREEADRKQAALKEAEAAAKAQKDAEAAKAADIRAKAAAAAREDAARREAERQKIARDQAEAAAKAKRDAEAAAKAQREAARQRAREEAARAEAARKEAEDLRAELREAERREAERRKEAQLEAKRAEAARKEVDGIRAEREKAERREAARRKEDEEEAALQRTRRVALVIGNSAYQWLGGLNNPGNDAEDVANALQRLNFTVFRGIDLKYAEMKEMLKEFKRAADREEVETALLFFGGHGVADNGINYLAPIDAGRKVSERFISLQDVMVDLASKHGIRIIFIDACRNNAAVVQPPPGPEKTTSPPDALVRSAVVVRGLVRPDVPLSKGGMYVAFAASPGQVARDGVGRNSPFAGSLLKHLPTPGLELRHLFIRVNAEVVAATGNEQAPEAVDRLPREFVFKVVR